MTDINHTIHANNILKLHDARKSAILKFDKEEQKKFLKDERYSKILKELIENNKNLNFFSKLIYKLKMNFYSFFNLAADYAKTALEIAELFPKESELPKNESKSKRPIQQTFFQTSTDTYKKDLLNNSPISFPSDSSSKEHQIPINFFTLEDQNILSNIKKIIDMIKNTNNTKIHDRLQKALFAQLNGIKRQEIKEETIRWCSKQLNSN